MCVSSLGLKALRFCLPCWSFAFCYRLHCITVVWKDALLPPKFSYPVCVDQRYFLLFSGSLNHSKCAQMWWWLSTARWLAGVKWQVQVSGIAGDSETLGLSQTTRVLGTWLCLECHPWQRKWNSLAEMGRCIRDRRGEWLTVSQRGLLERDGTKGTCRVAEFLWRKRTLWAWMIWENKE